MISKSLESQKTGPNASDIIISCLAIAKLFNLDGFNVDQLGEIERGFKRGAILSMSKDRLENSLDKLLLGDIIKLFFFFLKIIQKLVFNIYILFIHHYISINFINKYNLYLIADHIPIGL